MAKLDPNIPATESPRKPEIEAPRELWMQHGFSAPFLAKPPNRPSVRYIRDDLVPEWQPIETAPKDGTHVLGCGPLDNEYGYYVDVMLYWRERWTIVFRHDRCEPTHWMTIPSPLTTQGGE